MHSRAGESQGTWSSQSRDRCVRDFYPCSVIASEKAQTSVVEIQIGFSDRSYRDLKSEEGIIFEMSSHAY